MEVYTISSQEATAVEDVVTVILNKIFSAICVKEWELERLETQLTSPVWWKGRGSENRKIPLYSYIQSSEMLRQELPVLSYDLLIASQGINWTESRQDIIWKRDEATMWPSIWMVTGRIRVPSWRWMWYRP